MIKTLLIWDIKRSGVAPLRSGDGLPETESEGSPHSSRRQTRRRDRRAIAYRCVRKLALLLDSPTNSCPGTFGCPACAPVLTGVSSGTGQEPNRGRILSGPAHSATAGALNRCRLAGREELDETSRNGGGIPARQVVARSRDRHRVDFWNPLLH